MFLKASPSSHNSGITRYHIETLSDITLEGVIPIVPLLYKTGKIGVGQSGFWVVWVHSN